MSPLESHPGIQWWNGLTDADRRFWLAAALTAVPAEAYAYRCRCVGSEPEPVAAAEGVHERSKAPATARLVSGGGVGSTVPGKSLVGPICTLAVKRVPSHTRAGVVGGAAPLSTALSRHLRWLRRQADRVNVHPTARAEYLRLAAEVLTEMKIATAGAAA